MALHQFRLHDGFTLAAAMAFFGILCLTPLVLIATSFLGHFLGQSDEFFHEIVLWVEATLPQASPEFVEFLRGLVDKKISSGWVGVVFLFSIASFLFTHVEHMLDKILQSGKKRTFWHRRMLSIALIFITALVVLVPAQLHFLLRFLPQEGSAFAFISLFYGDLSYFVLHFLLFTLLLKVVPRRAVPWRAIGVGALFFACSTIAARMLFRAYMNWALERYHVVYGSLTVLVVLVLWLYYWSLIFIFCGELANAWQRVSQSPATVDRE